MAESLIQKLLSPSKFKIYDEQYEITVWSDLRVSNVSMSVSAETAKNPISTEYVADNLQTSQNLSNDLLATKVVQPAKIEAEVFIESISTVLAVIVAFYVQTKTFKITTKGVVAKGMAITAIEIDQSTEMLSAVKMKITFEQAEKTVTTGWNPAQSGDAESYGITVQPSSSIAGELQTVYNKVSSLWS